MSFKSMSIDQLETQLGVLILSADNPYVPQPEKVQIAHEYRLIVTELLTRPDWPNRDLFLAPLGGDPPYFYGRVPTVVLAGRLHTLAHAYPLDPAFGLGKPQAEIKAEYHSIVTLLLTRSDWDRRLTWDAWLPLNDMPPAYLRFVPLWQILITTAQRRYHLKYG